MQSSATDPLDLDKRMMHRDQYDMCPPPECGTWTQLHEQTKA